MISKAFASLRTTKCSTKSIPRALRVEAIYEILFINRLVGFAEPFGFHKGRSQ